MKKIILLIATILSGQISGMSPENMTADQVNRLSIPELQEILVTHNWGGRTSNEELFRERLLNLSQEYLKMTGKYPNISIDYLFPLSMWGSDEYYQIGRQKNEALKFMDSFKKKNFKKAEELLKESNGKWIDVIVDHAMPYNGPAIVWFAHDKDIVQFMLDHGADVNARNRDGATALIRAARLNDIETIELLLIHGADPSIRTYAGGDLMNAPTNGKTAVEIARLEKQDQAAEYIENWIAQRGSLISSHLPAKGVSGIVEEYLSGPNKATLAAQRQQKQQEAENKKRVFENAVFNAYTQGNAELLRAIMMSIEGNKSKINMVQELYQRRLFDNQPKNAAEMNKILEDNGINTKQTEMPEVE